MNMVGKESPETEEKKIKKPFECEAEREVAVIIAIQKLGIASLDEIIQKVEEWGGRLTVKQTEKVCKNLQQRGLLSVDLTEKTDGATVSRYKVKKVTWGVPEIAQIKPWLDSDEAKPILDELEKSKHNKKSLSANYYDVYVGFTVEDGVIGFTPKDDIQQTHYRTKDGEIMFFQRHFKRWLAFNLPIANRYPTVADRIGCGISPTKLNEPTFVEEFFITNVEGKAKGSGRGIKRCEVIPAGTTIKVRFRVSTEDFEPEDFKLLLEKISDLPIRTFGGYSKSGWGHLKLTKFELGGLVWDR